ncbi:MAG: trpB, partial [Marmoricola sp.]|nr:trpB [Marmoricola sp.]
MTAPTTPTEQTPGTAVPGRAPTGGDLSRAVETSTMGPDERGRFGTFGGQFMPEALMAALEELTTAWHEAMRDEAFTA